MIPGIGFAIVCLQFRSCKLPFPTAAPLHSSYSELFSSHFSFKKKQELHELLFGLLILLLVLDETRSGLVQGCCCVAASAWLPWDWQVHGAEYGSCRS